MIRAGWMEAERAVNRRERKDEAMGAGRWSRWGRGICEGYSLEFGFTLRFDIRPEPREGAAPPRLWHAHSRTKAIGDYPTFEAAAEACEAEARAFVEGKLAQNDTGGDMTLVLDHWRAFQALPKKQRVRARSTRRR